MRACRIGVPLWAVAAIVATSCSSSPGVRRSGTDDTSTTSNAPVAAALRLLAERRGLLLGTAVNDDALQREVDYRDTLATQFSMVEPENVMKWDVIHPAPDRFDFTAGDRLVAFAREHDMTVRGHTLVWKNANPAWLERGRFTRAQAITLLRDHIYEVVGHYRGEIAQWDVVNEALDDAGHYADNPWLRAIGPDYVPMAFRFAHDADPHAELYYNDYDIGYPGRKAAAILALVTALKHGGTPIDGVGMQFHLIPPAVDLRQIAEQMRTFADLGLSYAITEFDVPLKLPATDSEQQMQADLARGILRTCLAAPNCRTFNLWGFTDRHSWVPQHLAGYGAATPMDIHLRPKPAWEALRNELAA
jgi:endo-1,4-beta-xylanase